MKFKNNNKIKAVLLGCAGISLSLFLSASPITSTNLLVAESGSFINDASSNISVRMYDKNNTLVTSEKKSVSIDTNNYSYYSIKWQDVSYFDIVYSGPIAEGEKISYQFNVTWSPANVKDGKLELVTDRTEKREIIDTSASNEEDVVKQIRFYVDDQTNNSISNSFNGNSVLGESYIDNGGWGIYQFNFICNGTAYNSDLFEVTPTKISDISPETSLSIKSEAVRSQYSINNAYILSITSPEYKYIERNNIVWKVSGEGSDGKKYVLLPSDIEEGDKETKSILSDDAFDRTGETFKFDFDISGNWEITCEITNPENTEDVRVSNVIKVSTVKIIPKNLIIWIVVGSVALAGIILTVIIILAKKKEKIW